MREDDCGASHCRGRAAGSVVGEVGVRAAEWQGSLP